MWKSEVKEKRRRGKRKWDTVVLNREGIFKHCMRGEVCF